MCGMNLTVTNSNFVLKVYLRTLQASSRHNYYTAEVPISFLTQILHKTWINPCDTLICYSIYLTIIQRRKSKRIFMVIPKLPTVKIFALLPWIFRSIFFEKPRINLGIPLYSRAKHVFFFLTIPPCTFQSQSGNTIPQKGNVQLLYSRLMFPDYIQVN